MSIDFDNAKKWQAQYGSTDWAPLHQQICKREAGKQVIWQPRIRCWHRDRILREEPFPADCQGKDVIELYHQFNCSARPYTEFAQAYIAVDDPRVKRYKKAISDTVTAHVVETPVGTLTEEYRKVARSDREHRIKWRIETPEDLAVAQWLEESTTWRFDEGIYQAACDQYHGLCAPTMYTPRINIQELYICDMGVEEGTYALMDYPDEVEAYFAAKNANHMRLMEVLNQSPIDIINFGDNLHCGTLPPYLFEKYVLPHYQERCALLHTANKFVSAHWDGDTKTLLQFAKQTGLDGIEAITPKPQGDVTLEEMKDGLGDEVFLLDGIAAVLFDPEYTEDQLAAQTEELIRLFAGRLILGISDEMSYTGDIHRMNIVQQIVNKHNATATKG